MQDIESLARFLIQEQTNILKISIAELRVTLRWVTFVRQIAYLKIMIVNEYVADYCNY